MIKLYPYLTYAGALPFIFCAVCLGLDITTLPVLGSVEQALSVYALVIVTFLAGSHWGQHLQQNGIWSHNLPVLSNIMAVAIWIAFLVLPFKALLVAFSAAFFILLIIDKKLFQFELITHHYFRVRCTITAIVVSTLVFSGFVA